MSKKKILLLDMDGVIVDFIEGIFELAKKQNIDLNHKDVLDPVNNGDLLFPLYSQIGFFRYLKPMQNAIDTVNKLAKHYDTYIVTAPAKKTPHSLSDKQHWIEEHLPILADRVVMTQHKWLVSGDILIDDLPHNLHLFPKTTICFSQPWNQKPDVKAHHRVKDWIEVEKLLL